MSDNILESNSIPIPPQLAGLLKQTLSKMGTGFDEGAFLQQLHYWTVNPHTRGWMLDGVKWVYNSLKAWRSQFPWMSEYGLRKAIANLKKLGLIQTAQHWITSYQRIMFYRIDYEQLKKFAPGLCELFTFRYAAPDQVDVRSDHITDPKTSSDTSFQKQQTDAVADEIVEPVEALPSPEPVTKPAMEQPAARGENHPPCGSGNNLEIDRSEFPELIQAVANAIGQPPNATLRQAILQHSERVKDAIAYLQFQQHRRPINNPAGYLYEAFIGGWQLCTSNPSEVITPPGFKEWFDQAKKQGLVIAATAIEGVHHTLHIHQGWTPTLQLMQSGQSLPGE
jgi:hypothetical protein